MLMVIYGYVESIGELLSPPIFPYKICDNEKYYPGEPVNIHIKSLIDMIQDNSCGIMTKKG